jgi:hypothetical protein
VSSGLLRRVALKSYIGNARSALLVDKSFTRSATIIEDASQADSVFHKN